MKLLLASLVLLAANFNDNVFGLPFVVAPKEFRVNHPEQVVIISSEAESVDVEVEDLATKKNILFHGTFNLTQGEPLLVPIEIADYSNEQVVLSVINQESGEKRQSSIKLTPKSGFAFIQTDKPIYSPNDAVKIRLLRVDSELKPLEERIKLRIKNPQRIIVEEKTLTTDGPRFFADYIFNFPPAPKLGIWSAEAWFGTNFAANSTVTFELREYVLPTFSVKLKTPRMILPSTQLVNGSVKVEYVYGKPVDGSVTFKFGVKERTGKTTFIGTTREPKLLDNGTASFRFDTKQFKEFGAMAWFPVVNGMKFVAEATVHERVTGKKEKVSDDSSVFVTTPYVISFRNSFSDFKPDIETLVTGQVFDLFGQPVNDLPVSLHLVDERGVNIVPKYISPTINSSHLLTDSQGRVALPLTLKEGVERIDVTLRTMDSNYPREEQAEGKHSLFAHDSKIGFISIINRAKYDTSLAVGEVYQSALVMRGAIVYEQMYWMVAKQGKIIAVGRIDLDGFFKVKITTEMFPWIRIVVLAVTRDKTMIADSIKIHVRKELCNVDVKVKNEAPTYRPNSKISLKINGTPGSSLALLGVDEAVYILRNKDKLTQNKVYNEIENVDSGCGPGGGRNTLDVIDNVGFRLISSQTDILDENIGSCLKHVRVKRQTSLVINKYEGRLRRCCLLGMMPSKIRRTCVVKTSILKQHLPGELDCHEAFFTCCRENEKRFSVLVSHSAEKPFKMSTMNPFPGRTNIESVSTHVHIAYEEQLEKQALIRKDFRETWLFEVILLDESVTEYQTVLPHSITTWSITGMSMSKENGLCFLNPPMRIVSFQQVFLQVSMPYSVVQNEQIEIMATVFNYGNSRLNILLYTYGVENICSEAEEPGAKSTRKNIILNSTSSAASVGFPMVPLKAGKYEIKIVALWTGGSDVVVKTLTVIPPGVTVEDDFTFQLDPMNRQHRNKRSIKTTRLNDTIDDDNGRQITQIDLTPSRNYEMIVPNTQECILSAIADQFGSSSHNTLNDLNDLIQQPKGCGEQTMLFMAPTLYTLKYLESIDRLNGDLNYRARKYLKEGYKRELSFRKEDGSFSAFPIRPSSVWLTAFVLKVFCQAVPYLIDDGFDQKVVYTGIEWLLNEQKDNGSWVERHPVIHQSALGGVNGHLPLTAYIVITLHECSKVLPLDNEVIYALNKSEKFLIDHQESLIRRSDAYQISLVAYSLTFRNPKDSFFLIDWLLRFSNNEPASNRKFWRSEYQIEATSYALLAILNSAAPRNSIDALSIVNFLNSKRSFTGSFYTTQDTVIALEALARFAKSQTALPDDAKLVCNISSTNQRFKKSLEFHKENALILQTFKADAEDRHLEFHTHGNGIGLMSVKLKYNILQPPEILCQFLIDINVNEWKPTSSRENPDDMDEDGIFGDFPNSLVKDLEIKSRSKRSIFWAGGGSIKQTLDTFRDRIFNFSNKNKNKNDEELSANDDPNASNRISNLDLSQSTRNNLSKEISNDASTSKLVLVIEVCVRHIGNQRAEMSIIDVGILSGYKPNKSDLEEIIKMPDSLVSKYEESDRNVLFYLDTVPFGRPYCLQFRVIQNHVISNIQTAIVKVYDYYKQGHSCTQLYSPTRISALIATNCTSEVCQCAKDKNCPKTHQLVEIGKIAEKRIQLARDRLEELVCSSKYHFVFGGQFIAQNNSIKGFKLLLFKPEYSLRGVKPTQNIRIILNVECDEQLIELNKEILIFGQNFESGRSLHLNASSILYLFNGQSRQDEVHKHIGNLKDWLVNKSVKNNWKCAQENHDGI